ncbi:piggyBac transposable element-derived protein 4-like [Watersipora subatra]|uniref:piggyBac transposable element-derived protein 4-like n=1 Tax=Watersipora subatra TaxID=2589382 RepID=UPI00355AFFD0
MFSRDRFEAIYSTMLHASEVGSQGKAKIEPFVNKLIESFQAAFYPYKEVAVDEMVIGYNGKWSSKQYNSSKPSKYHIKTFGLCDSNTSYVYNLLIYFGADTSYDPELDKDCGEAVKVFHYLIKTLGPGHHIYADRYYTSLKLITFLKSHSMHYTGTLNVSRIGFPLEIKKKTLKLQHREHRNYLSEDKSILCVAWRDKKAKKYCTLVTTAHHAGQTEVQRRRETVIMPSVVANYNSFMGGCDKMDQILSYYGQYTRKTIKWWKRAFTWILEVAQANSYILYCLSHPDAKLTLLQFKNRLVDQLCEAAADIGAAEEPARRSGRPSVHLMERLSHKPHLVAHRSEARNCEVCSTPQERKRTNFVCLSCQVYLHPKCCFGLYHSIDYKK